jgi:phage-related protein
LGSVARKSPKAKPWKGEGLGVFEIVEDNRSDTYRAVYTVRFEHGVLRASRLSKEVYKESEDQAAHVRLISQRLKAATEDYEMRYGKKEK